MSESLFLDPFPLPSLKFLFVYVCCVRSDIYGGAYQRFGLKATTIASAFGKMKDNTNSQVKDEDKAADYQLQAFNRVLHCCWVPVARQLLAAAQTPSAAANLDQVQVRRVVREVTRWSAALGSAAARSLIAELTADGTLPPQDPLPTAAFSDLPTWLRN